MELAARRCGEMVDERAALDRKTLAFRASGADGEGAVGGENRARGVDRGDHPAHGFAHPAPGFAGDQAPGIARQILIVGTRDPPEQPTLAGAGEADLAFIGPLAAGRQ